MTTVSVPHAPPYLTGQEAAEILQQHGCGRVVVSRPITFVPGERPTRRAALIAYRKDGPPIIEDGATMAEAYGKVLVKLEVVR